MIRGESLPCRPLNPERLSSWNWPNRGILARGISEQSERPVDFLGPEPSFAFHDNVSQVLDIAASPKGQ